MSAPFTLRAATASDVPDLLRLQLEFGGPGSAPEEMRAADWRRGFAQGGIEATLAIVDGEPVGMAVTTPYEGSTLELLALYVVEAQRRRGIGTALVEHVLAAAQAAQRAGVVLHVHPSNAPAVTLYTRLGFTFTTDDLGPMMQHPFPQGARS